MGIWSIIAPDGSTTPLHNVSVHVQTTTAAGVASQHHTTVPLANGIIYQHSTSQQRTITLHLTPRVRGVLLPEVRLMLLAALNPDLATATSPAYIRYSGAHKTLQVPVVYTSGLEDAGAGDSLTLTLTAYDPIWTATTATSPMSLAMNTTLSNVGYIFQRSPLGEWGSPGNLNNLVYALVRGSDGMLYTGGAFTGTADYVARWNTTAAMWEAVGGGLATGSGSAVHTLCCSPSGMLYAGGYISGGVQQFDGTAWASLGLTDSSATTVYTLIIGNDGKLYAGGELYGNLHGHPISANVAVYDGTTWAEVAGIAGGFATRVWALTVGPDGKLYAGGDFTTPGGTYGHVAVWDGESWSPLGAGLDGNVYALHWTPDGLLVAGGDFPGAVAAWNGVVWRQYGTLERDSGSPVVYALATHPDGTLYAGGNIDRADGQLLPDRLAQWNGYTWFPLDGDFPITSVASLWVDSDGTLTFGSAGSGDAVVAGVTTITNAGSAAAYPRFTITGPGRIYSLTNWTTGEHIVFDLVLLAGEQLVLDLRPTVKTVTSSFRGNVISAVLPGSNLASWRLVPGDNQVGLLLLADSGTATATAMIQWHEREWTLDAAG